MSEYQETIVIAPDALLEQARQRLASGHRLVQICCTRLEQALQLTYSFDRDYHLFHLRLEVGGEAPALPSLSNLSPAAFTYENEIHDLFGVTFSGLNPDYKGRFYRMAAQFPWRNLPAAKSTAPAPAPAPATPSPTPPTTPAAPAPAAPGGAP